MELEIGLALSVLGGLLGVLSFVQSRDKSVEKDAAWRGGAKSAHHRLDEYA